VKPQTILDGASTPEGGEVVLYERGGVYTIRVNGRELMSSRVHGSEEELARLVCEALGGGNRPRVVIGGLGLGYTLRAALDALPTGAEVRVVELLGAVVEWNRGPLSHLAGRPLDDPRVVVEVGDVMERLHASEGTFDGVILDVDNGPDGLTMAANERIYRDRGLAAIHRALRPGGVLGVWSAEPDRAFARRLSSVGFLVSSKRAAARGGGSGPWHTVFLGRKKGGAPAG
jgi:spermidine synthase